MPFEFTRYITIPVFHNTIPAAALLLPLWLKVIDHYDRHYVQQNDNLATAGLDGAVILYDFKTEFDLVVRCYIQVGLLYIQETVAKV